ncbi:MAG: M16 family metallopeptidase [Xenococcaceae cyanobacterium]
MTSTLIKNSPLNAPTIHKLANGLTIIAEQMPVDAVNLNIWLNVGSVKETDDINGMAHFLEHMVFKGTPALKMGEFERLIEERGAATNAATSQDYTHYYITTAPKDFAELAPLQLDVVLNASIPDDAFERERLVVLEEIRRSDDNPNRRTFYRAMETCFDSLPYRRRVLGPASVIENVKAQQMRDFHAHWYQPQSMIAAVVGNLPVDELIEIVTKAFAEKQTAKTPSSPVISPNSFTPEPTFEKIVRKEYVDENLQQARLVMFWRVPGLDDLSQNYALDVLCAILGQGKVSRLYRDLREDRRLVTQIGTSNMTQTLQGAFYISAQLPVENLAEVEAAIAQHIKKLQTELISEAELARIRTKVANRFIFANERPSDRADLYGYYYSQLATLEPGINYPAYIQAVTPEDVRSVASRYLSPEAYGIVIIKPSNI